MTATALTYSVIPTQPFQASPSQGDPHTGTLLVVASNTSGAPHTIDQFEVRLPLGATAASLTTGTITPSLPAKWTSTCTEVTDGGRQYAAFRLTPPDGKIEVGGTGLTFEFSFPVNQQPGVAAVHVYEVTSCTPATDCPMASINVLKAPNGWSPVSFTVADPVVAHGAQASLTWKGPQGYDTDKNPLVNYTLTYYTPEAGRVSLPLPNEGTRTVEDLRSSTTFTLTVQGDVGGNQDQVDLQQTVTVMAPRLARYHGWWVAEDARTACGPYGESLCRFPSQGRMPLVATGQGSGFAVGTKEVITPYFFSLSDPHQDQSLDDLVFDSSGVPSTFSFASTAGGGAFGIWQWEEGIMGVEYSPSGGWQGTTPPAQWGSQDDDWSQPSQRDTIQLAALGDGTVLLVGRSGDGIVDWYRESNHWSVSSGAPKWANAAGWDKPEYYETIQLAGLGDGTALLVGRWKDGMHSYRFSKGAWAEVPGAPPLSDTAGWDIPHYYETIKLVGLGPGKALLIARSHLGLRTWLYSTETGWHDISSTGYLPFPDADSWDEDNVWRTIQACQDGAAGIIVVGHTAEGVWTYTADLVAPSGIPPLPLQWTQLYPSPHPIPAWNAAAGWPPDPEMWLLNLGKEVLLVGSYGDVRSDGVCIARRSSTPPWET